MENSYGLKLFLFINNYQSKLWFFFRDFHSGFLKS